jgi:hypothetical protein
MNNDKTLEYRIMNNLTKKKLKISSKKKITLQI